MVSWWSWSRCTMYICTVLSVCVHSTLWLYIGTRTLAYSIIHAIHVICLRCCTPVMFTVRITQHSKTPHRRDDFNVNFYHMRIKWLNIRTDRVNLRELFSWGLWGLSSTALLFHFMFWTRKIVHKNGCDWIKTAHPKIISVRQY